MPSIKLTSFRTLSHALLWSCLASTFGPLPALAQDIAWGYNNFGGTGLIDMPGALSVADGELAISRSQFQNTRRTVLTFQLAPRLSTSLRYSQMFDFNVSGDPNNPNELEFVFDRSFALHYRIVDEGRFRPAIAIGLNDFLGTGFFESEYLVATKTISPTVRVTAGLGWGRLAGMNSFENPLGFLGDGWLVRDARTTSPTGGEVDSVEWFQGNAALFGGVEWRPRPYLRLVAEYSSDTYPYEDGFSFDQQSPFNFGVTYSVNDRLSVGAAYMYGSELAVQLTYAVNPGLPRYGSGLEPAPPLVRWAPQGTPTAVFGAQDQATLVGVRQVTDRALDDQGIGLHGLTISGSTARIEIENPTYPVFAQALGRTARVLTMTLPPEIDQVQIVLIERGLPVSSTLIQRADLEQQEFAFDGAWAIQTRAVLADSGPGTSPLPDLYPRFAWGIEPYLTPSLFDPDNPFRADLGVDLTGSFELAPGLIFSGLIRQPVLGNLDESTRASTSVLPHVRSDAWLYDKAGTSISRLTGNWYFRPGVSLYGRVTAGLLEPMFGGVSAEVLWYPQGSRLAFGAEVNHVVQRDYDQMFSFRDYEVTTGHLSGYWDTGGGYQAQIDIGRYLAGDWGATFSFDRRFENGWQIGAFATLTDVPFVSFGEGSFDKGIRLTIPIGWVNGQASRDLSSLTIRPILRDGGARLDVDGRLYEVIRGANTAELADGWGRFWR